MQKVELTELEIAKLSAHNSEIKNLQNQMLKIRNNLQKRQDAINEIIDAIKERADLPEDYPTEEMNFEAVNWTDFEGEVIIPELDGEKNGD